MRLEEVRPNVLALTATRQELSALVAAARLATEVMRQDPHAPGEASDLVAAVLRDYDAAIGRMGRGPAGP